MNKNPKPFVFKRFSVWHHRSALKVGVDGVLVGAWADIKGAQRILDVGTGCGVIALMMAQRQPSAEVIGIDCDHDSVEEASINASDSPWGDRVQIIKEDFLEFAGSEGNGRFDLIVSNPPFYDSGVTDAETSRLKARHQGGLSPSSILMQGRGLLNQGGRVALIAPSESAAYLKKEATSLGYRLTRECLVRGHAKAPFKRILMEWIHMPAEGDKENFESTVLTLETTPGEPTAEYRELGKDFYLKF